MKETVDYEVTSPDGRKFAVTAPKAATREEVLAYAQQQFRDMPAQQKPATPQIDPTKGGLPFAPFGVDTGLTMPEGLSNAFAGAGKTITGWGRGVQQMLGVGDQAALQQTIDDSKRLDRPLMNTTGGQVGAIGAALVPAIGTSFIPGANTLTGSALAGTVMSAFDPVASDESRIDNMKQGAAFGFGGQLASKTVGAAIKPVANTVSEATQNLAQKVRQMGGQTTPGQTTGSKVLQQIEAGMESFPPTAGKMARIKNNNQTVLNRTVAKSFGEDAEHITESVLGNADQRIGDMFQNAVKDKAIKLDDSFINDLAKVEKKYGRIWGGRNDSSIKAFLNDALDEAARGPITGARYNELRSELSRTARNAFKGGNPNLGRAANEILDALDDAAAKSLPAESVEQLSTARSQWKSLLNAERALNGENISGAKLANILKKSDPKGFARGMNKSDLYEMVRFADRSRPIVGDSGTATRMAWQTLLSGAGGAGIAGLTGHDPTTGLMLGLGGPLAARMGQGAYLSRPAQWYLSNGIQPLQSLLPLLPAAGHALPRGILATKDNQ